MKPVDLHVHTTASHCGLHTLLEILGLAAEGGMQLIAITDHDWGTGTRTRVLSYRFDPIWRGVQVLPGMEFSIRAEGRIQVPEKIRLADLRVCLAGFHDKTHPLRDDPEALTDELERVLAESPFIDIIAHPGIQGYPLDADRAARLAKQHGVALEINNSALRYGKVGAEWAAELLTACRQHGTLVAVNSDAHTAGELGADELATPLVQRAGLGPDQVITASVERALAFVEAREQHKRSHGTSAAP